MFWADSVAAELKKRKLPLEWVDDMKTPSGRVHVGALRGVVIHDLIYKALIDAGVKAKYTYVFEDHDPMDEISADLPLDKFEKYLGMPLYKVPSPEKGFKNFAEYYALEFKEVFNLIGCHPEIIWVTDLYKSGKMNDSIRLVLDKADIVRGIYEELYKKPLPKDWYPFVMYCQNCGKVSTTKVSAWDGDQVTYSCRVDGVVWTKGCGHSGKVSPFSPNKDGDIVGKLPWKIEWAVKWRVIGVTVEGAGKDHMSAGGSHDLAKLVCERVLNYPVPYPIAYEFFLVGGRKMSSSKGIGSSSKEMSEILPPEILRFLMVKTRINQAINFDPQGDTIPKLFDDYQAVALLEDALSQRIFKLSQVNGAKKTPTIRFQTLAQWVQMPNMEAKIKEEGLEEWARYAKIWVDRFAPESARYEVQKTLPEKAKELSKKQKEFIEKVSLELDKEWDAEEFQKQLYVWAKVLGMSSNDAFSALYLSLIGKDHGPKAAWLILSLDKAFVQKRFQQVSSA